MSLTDNLRDTDCSGSHSSLLVLDQVGARWIHYDSIQHVNHAMAVTLSDKLNQLLQLNFNIFEVKTCYAVLKWRIYLRL